MVEYINEELSGAQLQEVVTTPEGVVLSFYRFNKEPKFSYLLFDLDMMFPFLGIFTENPWGRMKKVTPVSLFLNAHAKNQHFSRAEVLENYGRVVKIHLGEESSVEFRLIPKQVNFIVRAGRKSISWAPVKELSQIELSRHSESEEETRSLNFMMSQWQRRRSESNVAGVRPRLDPYESWKKNKEKDVLKKKKALEQVREQIQKYMSEPWAEIGDQLKVSGFKDLKPEWLIFIDHKKSVSQNIQMAFEKFKAAKTKISGAQKRLEILREEVKSLSDLNIDKFEDFLSTQSLKKLQNAPRKVEGRYRKYQDDQSGVVAYLGKSAVDNVALLRKSKPHDIWLHLKDYPSAHAIIHLQKNQKISDHDVKKIAAWLVKEGLSDKKSSVGGKFSVVMAECRHVRPVKGDKLGRVTYHNAREFLIAI